MESLSKKLIGSEGKLLVAQGKKDGDPYTIVLGKIKKREIPTYGDDHWDKRGEKMIPVFTSRNPRVHCIPVERRVRIYEILRELGFKHYKKEYSYLTYPLTGYVDKNIVDPKYGFELTYLALVSEEGTMNIIFPPNFTRTYEENARFRKLRLTQFFP